MALYILNNLSGSKALISTQYYREFLSSGVYRDRSVDYKPLLAILLAKITAPPKDQSVNNLFVSMFVSMASLSATETQDLVFSTVGADPMPKYFDAIKVEASRFSR